MVGADGSIQIQRLWLWLWAVDVAKLAEQSLPILGGSKPVIGKIYIEYVFTVNCIEKTKIKKKRGKEWPIFKQRELQQK